MKNKQKVSELKTGKVQSERSLYSTPKLTVYGSVKSLTQSGQGSGTDGGPVATMQMMSDRLTKENIVWIDLHPLGIGLYLYDYKPEFRDVWGHGRQFGVMADEVESVLSEAVSIGPDGYKIVNYSMLGISLSDN